MIRLTITSLLVSAVAAAFLLPAQAATPKLKGEVGPGFTIEVKMGSKDVKKLKAGKYTIKVEDKAAIHNFHLYGPGLNKKTVPHGKVTFKVVNRGQLGHDFAIAGKKTKIIGKGKSTTLIVTLRPGKIAYKCTVPGHAAAGMKGKLTVT